MKQTAHAKCFEIFSDNPHLSYEEVLDLAERAGVKRSNAGIEHKHWYYAGCGRFGPGKSDMDQIARAFPGDTRSLSEKADSLAADYARRGGSSLQECYAELRLAGFGSGAAWSAMWKSPITDTTDPYSASMFRGRRSGP